MIYYLFILQSDRVWLSLQARLESTAEFWKIFGEKFWLKNDLQNNSESSEEFGEEFYPILYNKFEE